MEKIGVPSAGRVKAGLQTWAYGAVAGQLYRYGTMFATRFTGNLPYGSLIAAAGTAALVGAMVRGEESKALVAVLGFNAGAALPLLDGVVGGGSKDDGPSDDDLMIGNN